MKISWKKYPNASMYDEYVTPQNSLRGHSKKIGTFLESLSIEDLKEIINKPISWRLPAIQECKNDYFTKYNLLQYLKKFIKKIQK